MKLYHRDISKCSARGPLGKDVISRLLVRVKGLRKQLLLNWSQKPLNKTEEKLYTVSTLSSSGWRFKHTKKHRNVSLHSEL